MSNLTPDEMKLFEEENTYWAELANALEELEKNPHFKKLILEGYFKDFAINQTSMLATDYVRKSGSRPEIMERLIAISNLQDWFNTVKQLTTSFAEEQDEE
jgi:hypothetical protein